MEESGRSREHVNFGLGYLSAKKVLRNHKMLIQDQETWLVN